MTLAPGGRKFIRTGTVETTGMRDAACQPRGGNGKLDLGDGNMTLDAGDIPNIRSALRAGLGDGTWNGNGIITSRSVTPELGEKNAGIGYASGSDPAVVGLAGNLEGQQFTGESVLLKYTYFGDSDLDGDADGNDVAKWVLSFTGELGGAGNKTWTQGDWDYDTAR